jgi:NAD(P)-dependent dehydrogenase (short-subunit alcohol dehydrogenase family)
MAAGSGTPQDPTKRFSQPETDDQMEHPGHTGKMTEEPDHGERSYVGAGRLKDRFAVVTGGDSGIGRAISLAFAREGADVAIAYLHSEQEDARTTADLVEAEGRRACLVPGDLRSEEQCQHLVDTVLDTFGRIDILVNNAAYQRGQPGGIVDITTEQLDRVMKTNLYALFWVCKAAIPHMKPGSSIINTTSIQSTHPSPELLDYATTKAGILNFTKGLAQQLAEHGIRVNAVAPGPIWTPLIPATMPDAKVKEFGKQTPLGRAGQPAEVAPSFVFLASNDASYITGEIIAVTGGTPL